jgi:hypothetical protein
MTDMSHEMTAVVGALAEDALESAAARGIWEN